MTTLSSVLPIAAEAVTMTTTQPAASIYVNGLNLDDNGALWVATVGTATTFHGGIGFTDAGAMLVADASGGLPAGVAYLGGLPVTADGALCVDASNAAARYVNGIPISANGGVTASGFSFAEYLLLETGDNLLLESGGVILLE